MAQKAPRWLGARNAAECSPTDCGFVLPRPPANARTAHQSPNRVDILLDQLLATLPVQNQLSWPRGAPPSPSSPAPEAPMPSFAIPRAMCSRSSSTFMPSNSPGFPTSLRSTMRPATFALATVALTAADGWLISTACLRASSSSLRIDTISNSLFSIGYPGAYKKGEEPEWAYFPNLHDTDDDSQGAIELECDDFASPNVAAPLVPAQDGNS